MWVLVDLFPKAKLRVVWSCISLLFVHCMNLGIGKTKGMHKELKESRTREFFQ
jgi:hypothetical protein